MSLKDAVVQDNLKTPRRFLGLRLAQTAGFVQDAIQLAAQNRQQLRETWEHQKALLGMESTKEQQTANGDDVGDIVVGDQQTTVYNMAPEQKPTTLGKFAKAAMLGAALLGAGGFGAVATAWMCGLFDKPKPVQAPPAIEFPEQDGYGLRIVEDAK